MVILGFHFKSKSTIFGPLTYETLENEIKIFFDIDYSIVRK